VQVEKSKGPLEVSKEKSRSKGKNTFISSQGIKIEGIVNTSRKLKRSNNGRDTCQSHFSFYSIDG